MHIYKNEFYENQQNGSYSSAKEILPIIFNLVHPKSVVDVGCGVGTWLKACQDLGVDDILGMDGPYVSAEMLQIPVSKFQGVDLSFPFKFPRKFDLVMSLEVAEHLPQSSAKAFVESLVTLGSVVLFSAAIPLQGGHNHINEQWQSYWADQFLENGYVAIDCIRPVVWENPIVEWWYAQNCILFVKKENVESRDDLLSLYQQTNRKQLCLVHPLNYIKFSDAKRISLSSVLRSLSNRLFSIFFRKNTL